MALATLYGARQKFCWLALVGGDADRDITPERGKLRERHRNAFGGPPASAAIERTRHERDYIFYPANSNVDGVALDLDEYRLVISTKSLQKSLLVVENPRECDYEAKPVSHAAVHSVSAVLLSEDCVLFPLKQLPHTLFHLMRVLKLNVFAITLETMQRGVNIFNGVEFIEMMARY